MNISKHFLFVTAAFFVVFARQSEAGLLGSVVTAVYNAAEDRLSSIIATLENSVVEGMQSPAYDLIKKDLLELASQIIDDEPNAIILKGLIEIVELVKASTDAAYNGLKAANSSTASSEVTIQNLRNAFNSSREYIVAGGVKSYMVLGALTAISQEGAKQGLNEASQKVTDVAKLALDGLDASRDLAIEGIDAGNDAASQGILAGYRGVQATEQEIYIMIAEGAIMAYAAIASQYLPASDNSQVILENDQAAAASPQCQKTIQSIEQSAEMASGAVSSAEKLKAIKVIRNSLIDASKTIAGAGRYLYTVLDAARLNPSKELAVEAVKKGIDSTQKKCVVAIATAQQGLGTAAKIVGKEIDPTIIKAMLMVEKGRVDLRRGLERSFLLASQGIENDASQKGLTAAREGVRTAGFSAYAQILKSAALSLTGIVIA